MLPVQVLAGDGHITTTQKPLVGRQAFPLSLLWGFFGFLRDSVGVSPHPSIILFDGELSAKLRKKE